VRKKVREREDQREASKQQEAREAGWLEPLAGKSRRELSGKREKPPFRESVES
jgi:hypothetical protein